VRAARGFTLIELLVVLLLIGAAYGLVGARLDNNGAVELKSATRQLAAGLRKTRGLAISERRDAAMTIDVEARDFAVGDDPKRYALPKTLDISVFTAQNELQDRQQAAIRFFPDGGSTGGRVTLKQAGRERAVDVDWLTGQVSVIQP
jgi:general secretion pathway protein H